MKKLTVTVPVELASQRADRALARLLPELAAWQLRDAFARRDVKCDGRRVHAGDRVALDDVLDVYVAETVVPLEVVHEDAQYAMLNKRQGMPSQGSGSAEEAYARLTGAQAFACHRLDVQTGGLLLLARDEAALHTAEKAFAAHSLQKTYQAVVCGHPDPPGAVLHAFLRKDADMAEVRLFHTHVPGSLPIETRYRTLSAQADTALLEVDLITGRTHQIRAHLASVGHPILGDDKYGNRAFNRAHGARRQKLWATRLTLWDGRTFEVEPRF